MNHLNFLVGVHAKTLQRLDREVMRVAAESPHADFFASKILRPLDLGLAENTVRQKVFYAADKNQVSEPLNKGADVADRSCDADFGIPIQGRGRRYR